MDEISPRLWLYNPNTSPLPLTNLSYFYSDSKIQNMTLQRWENGPQNLDDLIKFRLWLVRSQLIHCLKKKMSMA